MFLKKESKTTALSNHLVKRCIANDRRAQMQLYEQYCGGMFHVAMRFIGNAEDAEDVVQEAFIKAFRNLESFRGEVGFGAWLKRIVINGSIDFLKSVQKHNEVWDERFEPVVDDGGDDLVIDDRATIDDVRMAIARLPDKYRYVVMMYFIEGYDHAEIASVLQLSETASRTRLLRGKALLRGELKKKDYGQRSSQNIR